MTGEGGSDDTEEDDSRLSRSYGEPADTDDVDELIDRRRGSDAATLA